MTSSIETTGSSFDFQKSGYGAFIAILLIILALGFLGNVLTIIVLYQPSHRKETLTPLMLNLAVSGVFVTVFGYPMPISVIMSGTDIAADQTQCNWYGFVMGAVGIASIATFTGMTLVMSYSVRQMNPRFKVSRKISCCLIAASWVYGVVAMLPPLLGWTRFVVSSSGVTCSPDWTDVSLSGAAYSLLLIAVGFVVPLILIAVSYFKIFRYLSVQALNK